MLLNCCDFQWEADAAASCAHARVAKTRIFASIPITSVFQCQFFFSEGNKKKTSHFKNRKRNAGEKGLILRNWGISAAGFLPSNGRVRCFNVASAQTPKAMARYAGTIREWLLLLEVVGPGDLQGLISLIHNIAVTPGNVHWWTID